MTGLAIGAIRYFKNSRKRERSTHSYIRIKIDEGIKANNFSMRLQDPESSEVDCIVVTTYPPEYPEEVPPHLLLHVSHLKYFDETSVVQKCIGKWS